MSIAERGETLEKRTGAAGAASDAAVCGVLPHRAAHSLRAADHQCDAGDVRARRRASGGQQRMDCDGLYGGGHCGAACLRAAVGPEGTPGDCPDRQPAVRRGGAGHRGLHGACAAAGACGGARPGQQHAEHSQSGRGARRYAKAPDGGGRRLSGPGHGACNRPCARRRNCPE